MKKDTIPFVERRRGAKKVLFTSVSVFMTIWCVTLMYPLFWTFQMSLKTPFEYFTSSSLDWAKIPQWHNYVRIFDEMAVKEITFLDMLWNSIWRTFGTCTLGMFATATFSYCMAKFDFGIRPAMWAVIIFMMVWPQMGTGGAVYKQTKDLGLFDTPLALIKSLGGYGGGFFIIYSFMRTLSKEYMDAAYIDGAGEWTVYLRIMLPMAMGPILAMYTVNWISTWNDTTTVLMYWPSYLTLAAGLYSYQSEATRAIDYPLYYTGVIMVMIPTVTLFMLMQDKIMENMTHGGLKG